VPNPVVSKLGTLGRDIQIAERAASMAINPEAKTLLNAYISYTPEERKKSFAAAFVEEQRISRPSSPMS
jgi:hypothetical protein